MESNSPLSNQTPPVSRSADRYHALQFLPSRKILIILGILIVGGLGYFMYPTAVRIWQNRATLGTADFSNLPPSLLAQSNDRKNIDRDTDGDGVPDWQEALFNLDPENPDSNQDGIPDQVPADIRSIAENPNIVTVTDKLALTIYNELKADPTVTDDNVNQKLSAIAGTKVVELAADIENDFKRYYPVDIETDDTTPESIATYRAVVIPLITKIKNETKDFASITTANESIKVIDLKTQSKLLESAIGQMLNMTVPGDISEEHLIMTNSLYAILQMNNSVVVTTDADELTKYTNLLIIQKNINAAKKSMNDIKIFFTINAS